MISKIAGYREFKSKKGTNCRLLTVYTPYSENEKKNGAVGNRSEDIFLPDDCDLTITEANIGQDVVVDYTVIGGRAFVNGVSLLKK